jgi:alkanesulfonate monooxygenase SsuD/methylene tetrahydromethanopterin reductase-like flavin-dependent oxidoreductase (luciferase family)
VDDEVTMRFYYHYPETQGAEGDMLDPGPVHEVAAAAERAGVDGFTCRSVCWNVPLLAAATTIAVTAAISSTRAPGSTGRVARP